MPIALALALTMALQDIPTQRWASHVQMDDFTDELSGVVAAVKSEDRNSTVFSLICKERILTAAIVFPRAYLGDGFGSVRWRIDRLDHGEGKWIRDGRTARYFHNLEQNFDDLGVPDSLRKFIDDEGFLSSSVIDYIMDAPASSKSLLLEVTDEDGDTHKAEVTLNGAQKAIGKVLKACEK